MKIVHVTWALKLGGLETMLVNIANYQVNYAKVIIIVINKAYDVELIEKIDNNVQVIFLNRIIDSKNLSSLIKLNQLLFKIRPNVIHSHAPRIGMVLFPFIFKHKLFYTVHDVGIDRKYFKNYNQHKLASISKCVQKDLLERLQINSKVIYNGVLIENIKKKSKGKQNSNFRIVQVSRLMHEKKGQHILIEAISKLKYSGITDIEVDIIGEGNSEYFLKGLVKSLGLININFLGAKRYSYINDHLCDYDLLVQPSLFEGFGLTVVEAMAAKVPVLVSDVDGPMEIIDSGKFGYSFKSGSSNDCAEKIRLIMSNDNSEMVKLAYNRALTEFNVETTAKKYFEYYMHCGK